MVSLARKTAYFLLTPLLFLSAAYGSDLSQSELKTLEKLLDRLGFAPGVVDGIVDADTRAAIGRYMEFAALTGDQEPSPALLEELSAVAQAVTTLRDIPAPDVDETTPELALVPMPLAPLWVLRTAPTLAGPLDEEANPLSWPKEPASLRPASPLSESLQDVGEEVDPAQARLEAALAPFAADLRAGRVSAKKLSQDFNRAGQADFQAGNYEAAIAYFDVAIHLDPKFAAAYHNRAVAHEYGGNRELAAPDFERAYALGFGRLRKSTSP